MCVFVEARRKEAILHVMCARLSSVFTKRSFTRPGWWAGNSIRWSLSSVQTDPAFSLFFLGVALADASANSIIYLFIFKSCKAYHDFAMALGIIAGCHDEDHFFASAGCCPVAFDPANFKFEILTFFCCDLTNWCRGRKRMFPWYRVWRRACLILQSSWRQNSWLENS